MPSSSAKATADGTEDKTAARRCLPYGGSAEMRPESGGRKSRIKFGS